MKAALVSFASLLLALTLVGCPGEPGLTADVGGPLDGGARIDAPGEDGGTSDVDGGPSDVDGGTSDVDGGTSDVDGGTSDVDGGAGDVDGGSSDVDGGPAPVDGGVTPLDGGPAPVDAPSPRVDGGPRACRTNADCSATSSYCEKAIADCGGSGTCTPRPRICPLVIDPVCGCDGNDYGNPCEAAAAGVNVASRGVCAVTTCDLRPGAGCCFDDGDCGRGEACVGEVCRGGGEGTCHAPPRTGMCWEDSDCVTGTCMGERICPCGAVCLLPDAPGACGTITPGP